MKDMTIDEMTNWMMNNNYIATYEEYFEGGSNEYRYHIFESGGKYYKVTYVNGSLQPKSELKNGRRVWPKDKKNSVYCPVEVIKKVRRVIKTEFEEIRLTTGNKVW